MSGREAKPNAEIRAAAKALVSATSSINESARNEEQLRHEAEIALEQSCRSLGIPWTPFQLDRTLRKKGGKVRFVDVVHGGLVIEYEAPGSFASSEGHQLAHAKGQAEEYAELLHVEEGRPLRDYVLIAWDGPHIAFGHYSGSEYLWGAIQAFDLDGASRLLRHFRDDGMPLVHPLLLRERVGPTSAAGSLLLPALCSSIRAATRSDQITKTKLLFTEWRRLFGQVVGDPSDRLKRHLSEISEAHGYPYTEDPPAYLFALNTYIAIVAKLVAALALPEPSEDISDPSDHILQRIRHLESGTLFRDAGVSNMLNSDFFSWYVDDQAWGSYEQPLSDLVATLRGINFDVRKKDPNSTRDLFKGLYMTFAPAALRHALGEYYTPDWLAAHALDVVGWKPDEPLLDPTCGSGTFLLEGLRRRLVDPAWNDKSGAELVSGLSGFDLNPLAVLAARASIVVFLAQKLDPENPIQLPIYLADVINPATEVEGVYEHRIQTEKGERVFRIPSIVVESDTYFQLMQDIREMIDAELESEAISEVLDKNALVSGLSTEERRLLDRTIESLLEFHHTEWNGIWSAILADRFAAGAVSPVPVVVGNPPWVKWSNLPGDYAEFIKPICASLGIFSDDVWVGGIESDISTVVTYRALERFCAPGGRLAFFITGSVFANESSQGFRRWRIQGEQGDDDENFEVEGVEDFDALAPFEGVHNHPTLLVIRRSSKATKYPVPYKRWSAEEGQPSPSEALTSTEFRERYSSETLQAVPIPGSDGGPWLKGTRAQQRRWRHLFDAGGEQAFRGRKGVTTDANGIYFVSVEGAGGDGIVRVRNDPRNGRRQLPKRKAAIESEHVFPLLRGRGVSAFQAQPDPDFCILVPQREMHGDPELRATAPKTYNYLARFKSILETRASYRLYQRGKPFWSLWSTGPYTFSPYKVLWKEMAGGRFCAAYTGSQDHPILGEKLVIPDHKLYFVPVDTEEEAAYLTGLLNAPRIAEAVNAYAAALSLGVSVVEYLRLPAFSSGSARHQELAALSQEFSRDSAGPVPNSGWGKLDELVQTVLEESEMLSAGS
jgi:Putative RNA methylase family UPF0020